MNIQKPFLTKNKMFDDTRGSLSPVPLAGLPRHQMNIVTSYEGTIRGLHFQNAPQWQTKLVTVITGSIRDVLFCLITHELFYFNMEPGESLYVPWHYAHGFYSKQDSDLVYLVGGGEYNPEKENGIRFDDKELDINWFSGPSPNSLKLSGKDLMLRPWSEVSPEVDRMLDLK